MLLVSVVFCIVISGQMSWWCSSSLYSEVFVSIFCQCLRGKYQNLQPRSCIYLHLLLLVSIFCFEYVVCLLVSANIGIYIFDKLTIIIVKFSSLSLVVFITTPSLLGFVFAICIFSVFWHLSSLCLSV